MRCAPLHALWLVAIVLGGVSAAEEPSASAAAQRPMPDVELHGRRAIALRDGRPVRWFDDEQRPIVRVPSPLGLALRWVDADGRIFPLDHRTEARGEMNFLVVENDPPLSPGELQLRQAGFTVARWPAEWRRPPKQLPAVARIVTLAAEVEGDPEDEAARCASETEIATIVDRQSEDEVALWATLLAANKAKSLCGPDEDHRRVSEAAYVRAAELAARQRVPSERVSRLCAAAFWALVRSDFTTAAAYLDEARSIAAELDAEARLRLTDVSLQLYYLTARWREAHAAAVAVTDLIKRAGPAVDELAANTGQIRAALAQSLGNHRAAVELIEPLVDIPTLDPETRASFASNAGFVLLQAMERGAIPRDFGRVRRLFEQAAALLADTRSSAWAHVQLNLALVELLDGHWSTAAALIAPFASSAADEIRGFASLLTGRLELAQGRWAEARAPFEAAEAAAVAHWGVHGGDYGWRAALGLGQAARAAGDLQTAETHFARARTRLKRLAALTDPLEQRIGFLDDRAELLRASLTLAIERGDQRSLRRAFTLADRNQGRVLRTMLAARLADSLDADKRDVLRGLRGRIAEIADEIRALKQRIRRTAGAAQRASERELKRAEARQRAAVKAVADFLDAELPLTGVDPAQVQAALEPGQTIMVVARRDGGRVALWASATAYETTPLPEFVDDDTLPTPPWSTAHLYVVAGGHPDVVAVAFRAANYRPYSVSLLPAGELLVAERKIPCGPPTILADPTSELGNAYAEGEWLARTLPGSRLFAREAATGPKLEGSLKASRLVHFSGHGESIPDHPWSTHLVMAGKKPFDVFDILGLEQAVAGLVVLNGCQTGADALSTRDDVLGLPEALLVAGSGAVVATDRPVRDEHAKLFSEAFYVHGGDHRPGPALRAATRALLDAGNESWNNWRLVGRPHIPIPPERSLRHCEEAQ